jgi:hypothetical protein
MWKQLSITYWKFTIEQTQPIDEGTVQCTYMCFAYKLRFLISQKQFLGLVILHCSLVVVISVL